MGVRRRIQKSLLIRYITYIRCDLLFGLQYKILRATQASAQDDTLQGYRVFIAAALSYCKKHGHRI